MLSITTILSYYIILITSILFSITTGKCLMFLFKIKKSSSYFNVFIELFLGISFSTVLYAIYKTSGNTVMWGLVILGAFFLFELKKGLLITSSRLKNDYFNKDGLKVYAEIILLSSIYFIWQLYTFIDFETLRFVECNADLHSLASNIDLLNSSGIERFIVYDIPGNIKMPMIPYHYFEYWFIAVWAGITNSIPILIFKLVQVPIFLITLYLSFITLFKSIGIHSISLIIKLICALFIFVHSPIYNNLLLGEYYYRADFLTSPLVVEPLLYKSIHLLIIFNLVAVLFFKNHHRLAIITLLSLPVISYASLPIVGISIIGLLLIFLISSKVEFLREYALLPNKQLFRVALYLILILFFLVLFYWLNTSDSFFFKDVNNFSILAVLEYYSNTIHIKDSIKLLFKASFGMLEVYLIPTLFIFVISFFNSKKTNLRLLLILFLLVSCVSLLMMFVFIFNYDSFVLLRLLTLPILIT